MLDKNHIELLKKGLTFSPTTGMDHFEVYKDLCLYLRKIYYRLLYADETKSFNPDQSIEEDQGALDILESLLEEAGEISEDDELPYGTDAMSTIYIRSSAMPKFRTNK